METIDISVSCETYIYNMLRILLSPHATLSHDAQDAMVRMMLDIGRIADAHIKQQDDDCDECGGMGHTIGFEGPKKVKYPCETCSTSQQGDTT